MKVQIPLTQQERAARTFAIMLQFSVMFTKPRQAKKISQIDKRFLERLANRRYISSINVSTFVKLVKLEEKYLC